MRAGSSDVYHVWDDDEGGTGPEIGSEEWWKVIDMGDDDIID